MGSKKTIFIRIVLWLILAIFIGWLSYLKIVPSGKISYVYDFTRPSYFIGRLTPDTRVNLANGQTAMTGDPIYFSLRPPRRFESAKVTVEFKNHTDFPVMEIGLLNDKVAWGYDLKPLQNKIIDQLSLVWPAITGPDGSRLIEREKTFDTTEQFLSRLPGRGEIALYDYNLKADYKLAGYKASAAERSWPVNLRGSYQFYTYIDNETLRFDFSFLDLNENKDADPVEIKVFSGAGMVYDKKMADDAAEAGEKSMNVKIAGLAEGVYRVSLIATDDIITKSLVSPQSRLSFLNKVWLASGAGAPALYTNSRQIGAQTINPASLGAIKAGAGTLDLSQPYKQFFLKTQSAAQVGPVKIEPAKNDVIISGDGVFSFAPEALIDPRFKTVDANLDLNREPVNYVLTGYRPPERLSDGWYAATADFDLTKAYQENGKYQFLISLPGLGEGNRPANPVLIKEIKIELKGTSLAEKLKKIFSPSK